MPAEEQSDLERKERLLTWLKNHWSESHRCPVCAAADWHVDDYGRLPTEAAGADAYPLFPITCQVCGYVFFLNGVVAGALPSGNRPTS